MTKFITVTEVASKTKWTINANAILRIDDQAIDGAKSVNPCIP